MDFDKMRLAALPKPQPGREVRRKLMVAAVSALILLAAMIFWVTRDEGAKRNIVTQTRGALQSAGLEPLVGAGKELLAPASPPPSLQSVPERLGAATSDMPAGSAVVQGPVADPAASAAGIQHAEKAAENPDASAASAPPPGAAPQQREDSIIRPAFVRDLAQWLAARYKPAPRGAKGQVNISLQAVNMRYGMSMRGMERKSKDPAAARAQILRYAFNPAMLDALYGIYAERLVHETARAALAPEQGKALNKAQLEDLYHAYAAFFADLAGVTGGIASMPDLAERIENINRANHQTLVLHRQLTENVFALDEAREAKNAADIRNIEARIDNLNQRYRAGMQNQSNARAALVAAVRNNSRGRSLLLDDDSLLFLALWINRRIHSQSDALAAVGKASSLLTELSRRFEQAGGASRKAAGTR